MDRKLPNWIRGTLAVGALITLLGHLVSMLFGLSGARTDAVGRFLQTETCQAQKRHLEEVLSTLNEALSVSEQRKDVLESQLLSRDPSWFLGARKALHEETRYSEEIKRQIALTRIGPPYVTGTILGVYRLLSILICFWASKAIFRQCRWAYGVHCLDAIRDWNRVFPIFAIGIFLALFLRVSWTSIFLVEKTWFTFDSFCIEYRSFLASRFADLGVAIVLACPATLLWLLTDSKQQPVGASEALLKEHRRPVLNPTSSEGFCGVAPYLAIQETWFLMTAASVSVVLSTWLTFALRSQVSLHPLYLVNFLISMLLAMALMYRSFQNMLAMRALYRQEVAFLGGSWMENQDRVAPDPTERFLGQSSWSIGTRIVGYLGLIWAFLKWSGISEALVGFLR